MRLLISFLSLMVFIGLPICGEFHSHSININVGYTSEYTHTLKGGNKTGGVFLDNVDFTVEVDLDSGLNIPNTTFFAYILANHGGSPSAFTGDFQTISNIDTSDAIRVFELWVASSFFDDRLSILAGLYDLNSEFDSIQTASLFTQAPHGIGTELATSSEFGPSIFPSTSLAVRAHYEWSKGRYIQGVILDGTPGNPNDPFGLHIMINADDGILGVGEFGFITQSNDRLKTKYTMGLWGYSRKFESHEDSSDKKRNRGIYASIDHTLTPHLDGFIRIGASSPDVNQVSTYLGTGIVRTGVFFTQKNDKLGLGIATAINSESYKTASPTEVNTFETLIELTYLYPVNDHFEIQPMCHYIINPNMDPRVSDAIAWGTRFSFMF